MGSRVRDRPPPAASFTRVQQGGKRDGNPSCLAPRILNSVPAPVPPPCTLHLSVLWLARPHSVLHRETLLDAPAPELPLLGPASPGAQDPFSEVQVELYLLIQTRQAWRRAACLHQAPNPSRVQPLPSTPHIPSVPVGPQQAALLPLHAHPDCPDQKTPTHPSTPRKTPPTPTCSLPDEADHPGQATSKCTHTSLAAPMHPATTAQRKPHSVLTEGPFGPQPPPKVAPSSGSRTTRKPEAWRGKVHAGIAGPVDTDGSPRLCCHLGGWVCLPAGFVSSHPRPARRPRAESRLDTVPAPIPQQDDGCLGIGTHSHSGGTTKPSPQQLQGWP